MKIEELPSNAQTNIKTHGGKVKRVNFDEGGKDLSKSIKREKKSIESHFAYQFADLIIVFIGISLFFLPAISLWSSIPKEFIFGATLSSFLLACSDGLIMVDRMSFRRFCAYGFCFVFGILSLVYVPVILTMFPKLFPEIEPFSDILTISALGFVLIVIGFRSFNFKKKFQEDLREDLIAVQDETQKQLLELGSLRSEATKLERNIQNNSQEIKNSRIEIDQTVRKLLEENEGLKKQLKELKKE